MSSSFVTASFVSKVDSENEDWNLRREKNGWREMERVSKVDSENEDWNEVVGSMSTVRPFFVSKVDSENEDWNKVSNQSYFLRYLSAGFKSRFRKWRLKYEPCSLGFTGYQYCVSKVDSENEDWNFVFVVW